MSQISFILRSVNVPDSLCHETRKKEIESLPKYLQVVGDLTAFNIGAGEPIVDNRDRPWLRTDPAGRPLGLWYFYNGRWVRDYGYAIGQPVIFTGNPTNITDPFAFADGTNGTPDLRPYMVAPTSKQMVDQFTGDGSNKTFDLTETPNDQELILVQVDAALLRPVTQYTRSGKTISTSTAPGSGKIVTVQYKALPTSTETSYTLGWMIFKGYV